MERGRGTETEEGLGTQFGAVTQDTTLPPSRLPNTSRVQETALRSCASRRLHNQRGCRAQEWPCEHPR